MLTRCLPPCDKDTRQMFIIRRWHSWRRTTSFRMETAHVATLRVDFRSKAPDPPSRPKHQARSEMCVPLLTWPDPYVDASVPPSPHPPGPRQSDRPSPNWSRFLLGLQCMPAWVPLAHAFLLPLLCSATNCKHCHLNEWTWMGFWLQWHTAETSPSPQVSCHQWTPMGQNEPGDMFHLAYPFWTS